MDFLTRDNVAQALGLVGFLVSLVGYTSASDRRLKVMMTVGLVFLTVHFMVFGAWLVALNLTLNTGRTWLSLHRRGFRWFVGIAAVQLAASLPLVGAVRDVFPVAGSIMGTYALFCLSGVQLRVALLVTTGLWFVNNLLWRSIGAVLLDFVNALAHLVAIHRIRAATKDVAPDRS
jgi:hypothetical protein